MAEKKAYFDLSVVGKLTVNDLEIVGAYSFPNSDGTVNQVLTTDGAGNLTFQNLSAIGLVASSILNGTGLTWTYNGINNTLTGNVSLAPFSTTNLTEGSNLYFTNERVDDRVDALLAAGVGITKAYNDAANTLTLGVTLTPFTTDNLAQGSTNLYFSNELVDDRVSALLQPGLTGTGANSITWQYVDGLNTLTPIVSLTPFSTSNLTEGTNLYFTNLRVDTRVAALIQNSATVTWVYDNILGTLTATAVGSTLQVRQDNAVIGSKSILDFLTGTNITPTIGLDPINNKITAQFNWAATLNDLTGVSLAAESAGDVLIYDGADWINTPLVLDQLNDVALLSPIQVGDLLVYDGANWVNSQIDLESLLDVVLTSPIVTGDVLTYNGTFWENQENPVVIIKGAGVDSTVRKDLGNIASATLSTVSGGCCNTASGCSSTIGGGQLNLASSCNSVVAGGCGNSATGNFSVVSGGYCNTASGLNTTVAGGNDNLACNTRSTVGGGCLNYATGDFATIAGGGRNQAINDFATVAGGVQNCAKGVGSVVAGGADNSNSGLHSIIGAGSSNCIDGDCSVIAGGYCNIANCCNSTIGGGCNNLSNAIYSSILGGYCNAATGTYSIISGGSLNCSTCNHTTVAGGRCNVVSACNSTIGGGFNNTVSGIYSTIPGGQCNTVTHSYASAVGCGITSVCNNTLHVNCLNLYATPIANSTGTQFLVRDTANGMVGYRAFGGIFSQTANGTTVTATAAETAAIGTGVGSLTVPANGFVAGDSFIFEMGGTFSAVNNETLTIRVKSGSVVLADSGAITLPTVTSKKWHLELCFTIRTIGAATVASILTDGLFTYNQNSGNSLEGYGFNTLNTTTFDTTTSNTLNVTMQWGSSNAGNSIVASIGTLIKVF